LGSAIRTIRERLILKIRKQSQASREKEKKIKSYPIPGMLLNKGDYNLRISMKT
jgi:hypothetical protein